MEVNVTFRHMESTEAITGHAKERAARLQHLLKYPIKIHIILGINKSGQNAEVTCHAEQKEFVASTSSKNLYESIDSAIEKVASQIKKDRDRRKGQQTAHQIARGDGAYLASDIEADIPHAGKGERRGTGG